MIQNAFKNWESRQKHVVERMCLIKEVHTQKFVPKVELAEIVTSNKVVELWDTYQKGS